MWLDDMRPAPRGWTRAHDADQAKQLLMSGDVVESSLDHDLGLGEPDGTDLVTWMIENDVWPPVRPCVHSANPAGAARMNQLIDDYGPYSQHERPTNCYPRKPSWSWTGP